MKGLQMRPESNSRRLFGITRSKGKMYEFGLPEQAHIAIPQDSVPEQLLLLTIGTLGDVAAEMSESNNVEEMDSGTKEELHFSSSYFDALIASRLSQALDSEIALLASATYYLGGRPGSSLVMARSVGSDNYDAPFARLLHWLLEAKWSEYPTSHDGQCGKLLDQIAKSVSLHFYDGSGVDEIKDISQKIRDRAYRIGEPHDIIFADLMCAVIKQRIYSSSWINMPTFTGLSLAEWTPIIQNSSFPKELWPSQMQLGNAGVFAGTSSLVQMPTSAGKTRSVEIMLRSAFISERASVAIVVAPFRALCHEISQSLREAFRVDDYKVDELSDALQPDYLDQIAELFGIRVEKTPIVIVLTPEKLLYVLRQTPTLVDKLGLVVFDEGHQFDSGYRGVTYELLLTEIKQLLPAEAQLILISAVIQNARAIANWLIGEDARVVTGRGLLPTARSVAFASWMERLGQMIFFEEGIRRTPDYFVPRIIEEQELRLFRNERKRRFFPERESTTDISLYLGLRLVPEGAIAIFCGLKATAEKIVSRSVEIYTRDLTMPVPAAFSDSREVQRLKNLYVLHFGEKSTLSKAAEIGVYAHHGNTPQGIRLSIEYAMQQGAIKFVACTSTLAQGVNLPIRYLIVSGVNQGQDRIKVRDFHNLMGRAGRAGMHTEGLVIFADPDIYDKRHSNRSGFNSAKELLDADQAEPTSSSLLGILEPLKGPRGTTIPIETSEMIDLLLQSRAEWEVWFKHLIESSSGYELNEKEFFSELTGKRKLVMAIESYLMAHRTDATYEEFLMNVGQLAVQTLAYSLADDSKKRELVGLFLAVAQFIESREPEPVQQALYAKTLLGVESARSIQAWTYENRDLLLSIETSEAFLEAVWEILKKELGSKFTMFVEPSALPKELAEMWLAGRSYESLFNFVIREGGTKPWGEKRHRLSDDDVINFCENTLGFDFPLGVAAITQFLFGDNVEAQGPAGPILIFHKAMKYGISDALAVSCYEAGFADRMLAQKIAEALRNDGYIGGVDSVAEMGQHANALRSLLAHYPNYFNVVLGSMKM